MDPEKADAYFNQEQVEKNLEIIKLIQIKNDQNLEKQINESIGFIKEKLGDRYKTLNLIISIIRFELYQVKPSNLEFLI